MTERSVILYNKRYYMAKLVDKERRKREITIIALKLFAENGFGPTSIKEIAHVAGIGKGTIYEYFKSKEDLVLNAVALWAERIEELVEEEVSSVSDPAERLRRYVHSTIRSFIADERMAKITINVFQMLLCGDRLELQHDKIRQMIRTTRKAVVNILLYGIKEKAFRPEIAEDTEKIAINLLAYVDGISIHYFIDKDDFEWSEQVDLYLERLFQSIKI